MSTPNDSGEKDPYVTGDFDPGEPDNDGAPFEQVAEQTEDAAGDDT